VTEIFSKPQINGKIEYAKEECENPNNHQNESNVVYVTQTYGTNAVPTNAVTLLQTVTSVFGIPNNPATSSDGQEQLIFPYVAVPGIVLALGGPPLQIKKGWST